MLSRITWGELQEMSRSKIKNRTIEKYFGPFLLVLLVFLLPMLVYQPATNLGWISDDYAYTPFFKLTFSRIIEVLGMIHAGEIQWEFLRPGGYLLWNIDYRIWGDNSAGFHFTNIFLHSLNAILVFSLARLLGLNRFGAATAGLVFGMYPGVVEPVAWISGRFDLFSFTCLLAALNLWCIGRIRDDRRYMGWSVAAFALGILTKETAFMGLFLLPLIDWVLGAKSGENDGKKIGFAWNWYVGWLAAIVVFLTFTYFLLGDFGGYRDSTNRNLLFQTDFETYWNNIWNHTLLMLVTPVHRDLWEFWPYWIRSMFVGFGLITAVGSVLTIGSFVYTFSRGNRMHFTLFVLGLVWIVLMILPTGTLHHVGYNLDLGRWLYFPAAGLALWLGTIADFSWRSRQISRMVALVLLTVLIFVFAFALDRHLEIWTEASRYTKHIHDTLEQHTRTLPDNADIFIVNLPTEYKGAHFAPLGFNLYLEHKYGIVGARVHYVNKEPWDVNNWWARLVSNWHDPAIGFVWMADRSELHLLPPVEQFTSFRGPSITDDE